MTIQCRSCSKGYSGNASVFFEINFNCLHDRYFCRTLNYNILPCCISSTVYISAHKYMQYYYILYSILDFSHEGTAQLDKFPQVSTIFVPSYAFRWIFNSSKSTNNESPGSLWTSWIMKNDENGPFTLQIQWLDLQTRGWNVAESGVRRFHFPLRNYTILCEHWRQSMTIFHANTCLSACLNMQFGLLDPPFACGCSAPPGVWLALCKPFCDLPAVGNKGIIRYSTASKSSKNYTYTRFDG